MGCCSGGGGDVTSSAATLPEYAQPYYEDLLARTGYESAVPYDTYPERRLQPFSASEQEALTRFGELGTSGPSGDLSNAMYGATMMSGGVPYAANMLGGVDWAQQAIASGAGSYDPNRFNPDRLNDQRLLGTYMSPYQQMVTDIAKREAIRDSNIMGQEMSLAAAGQGSLGGYREGIMQAERQRNLGQNLTDIQERGLQSAYNNAQAALEADRAALFGAHTDYERGRQFGAGQGLQALLNVPQLGMSAYDRLMSGEGQRLGAIQTMGQLDAQRQQMEMDRIMAMQAAGQTERELLQRGLDIGYADFLRQQAYPKEQLSFYSSMLQGLPITPGSIQTAYGVGPSTTQQLLGSGIAGVGLYNALR